MILQVSLGHILKKEMILFLLTEFYALINILKFNKMLFNK